MRSLDDIAVPAEVILSLKIDGFPSSDRALRRHAASNRWPVVYNEAGKRLFLVDAIPEPFGQAIRDALKLPVGPVPPQMIGDPPPVAYPDSPSVIMEARLAIVFEVARRAAYNDQPYAIRSMVADASEGRLSPRLSDAVKIGVITGSRSLAEVRSRLQAHRNGDVLASTASNYLSLSYATIRRWIDAFNKQGARGLFPGSNRD